MEAEESGPRANGSPSLHQDPPAESQAEDNLLSPAAGAWPGTQEMQAPGRSPPKREANKTSPEHKTTQRRENSEYGQVAGT